MVNTSRRRAAGHGRSVAVRASGSASRPERGLDRWHDDIRGRQRGGAGALGADDADAGISGPRPALGGWALGVLLVLMAVAAGALLDRREVPALFEKVVDEAHPASRPLIDVAKALTARASANSSVVSTVRSAIGPP